MDRNTFEQWLNTEMQNEPESFAEEAFIHGMSPTEYRQFCIEREFPTN